MRTARKYLALEIYRSSAVMLLALVALFTFFSLIEELDNIGKKFTLANLFYLELLATPTRVYDLLPIGLLIGSILSLASLAQRNELVILRVSGVSGIRLIINLWLITIPVVLLAFFLSEIVTPAAELKYSEANMKYLGKAGGGRLHSGYWFKESDENGDTRVINIRRIRFGGEITDVNLFELNKDYQLNTFSQAASGQFQDNKLILNDVSSVNITSQAIAALANANNALKPLTMVSKEKTRMLNTTLTAERLLARVLTPEKMSVFTLLDYIHYLKNNHLQTERQVVALWRKFAYPFTMLVMITIAAPISFMQTRRGGVGGKVFVGILLGVGFFMLNQLALNVGMLSKWQPWFTALAPNIVAWFIALLALLFMENQHNIKRLKYSLSIGSKP